VTWSLGAWLFGKGVHILRENGNFSWSRVMRSVTEANSSTLEMMSAGTGCGLSSGTQPSGGERSWFMRRERKAAARVQDDIVFGKEEGRTEGRNPRERRAVRQVGEVETSRRRQCLKTFCVRLRKTLYECVSLVRHDFNTYGFF
jgi:hypothetical protein